MIPRASPMAVARRRMGWLQSGMLVAILSVPVGGFVVGLYATQQIERGLAALLVECTDAKPMAIESVVGRPGEYEELERRAASFLQALESAGHTDPLVLSERDLNLLIAAHPELAPLCGLVLFQVAGERIACRFSLPMADRHLNGSCELSLSLSDGRLAVQLESFEGNGRQISGEAMNLIRQIDLAAHVTGCPEVARLMRMLRSIDVADGQITIQAASG